MLCGKDGRWKKKLEELLQPNQVVILLSLGDMKYDVLRYLNAYPHIQILRDVHKYYKERKGVKGEGQVKRKQD